MNNGTTLFSEKEMRIIYYGNVEHDPVKVYRINPTIKKEDDQQQKPNNSYSSKNQENKGKIPK